MLKINKAEVKKNLISNFFLFIANAIIGVFLPPYIINNIGISAYSLIPLSMSLTSLMLVITISVNGTLSKFLTVDFNTENEQSVNKTFNTAFFILLVLVLLLIPVAILFVFNIDYLLNIDKSLVYQSKFLFSFVFLAFFINTFLALYNSIPFAKNRIDIRNWSLIITKIGTILLLYLFFITGILKIWIYGLSLFLSTFIALLYSTQASKKLFSKLKLSLAFFDKEKKQEIISFGGWLIVNQLGVLLFLQTDIVVVNKVLGAELSGVFGALLQWSFLIRAIIGILGGVLVPIILNLYAKGEVERLKTISLFSVKILGFFTYLIVFNLTFFSGDLIEIWLGESFIKYKWVFIIMLIHLIPNMSVSALFNLNLAYTKVKIPGIVTMLSGVLNLILGYILLKYTNMGLLGIAISGLISLSIKNFIFTPWYVSKITKINSYFFYKEIIKLLVLSIIVLLVNYFFASDFLNINNSFLLLIIYMVIFTLLILIFGFLFYFKKEEKSKIYNLIKSKI